MPRLHEKIIFFCLCTKSRRNGSDVCEIKLQLLFLLFSFSVACLSPGHSLQSSARNCASNSLLPDLRKLTCFGEFLEWQACHSYAETLLLNQISYHRNVSSAIHLPIFFFFCQNTNLHLFEIDRLSSLLV